VDVVDLQILIDSNVIPAFSKKAKLVNTGVITRAITFKGVNVTDGARQAIEAAGGKVEA
jgi:large subunit ribosomal protein L15